MSEAQNSLDALLHLQAKLFLDISKHHPHLKKTLLRDFRTLVKRTRNEGVSFLTQTLPKLGKAIYRSLETELLSCPSNFKRIRGSALPRFLGGLLSEVYNVDGTLKQSFEIVYLNDILQILQFMYKLEIPYSQKCEQQVLEDFKHSEETLKELEFDEDDSVLCEARGLAAKILKGFDPMEILPCHGPGAVATREKSLEKWNFSRKYNSIHRVYPYYDYFVPSRMSLFRSIEKYRSLELRESGTARVVLVPKDSRGPRIISMEPLEFQYIQQGIARSLVRHLEQRCSITRGFLNFTDQTVNQKLAAWNSVTRRYATLDMKSASDLVSLKLVKAIFKDCPTFLKCILATRTESTELPDGTILSLQKFAPMGSALCFPVEALVFFILAKVLQKKNKVAGKVYVYGDDIIVPSALASPLFEAFPIYGLRFNEDKCFKNGFFRESCGMDCYKGEPIVPIRMKKELPRCRKQATSIVSLVELSNNLYQRGFWHSAQYLRQLATKLINVNVYTRPNYSFGGLSFVSFTSKGVITEDRVRVKPSDCREPLAHRPSQIRTWIYSVPMKDTTRPVLNWEEPRLLSNLLTRSGKGGLLPANCWKTWERSPVPHAGTLKLRWITFW